MQTMEWPRLLSHRQLGKKEGGPVDPARSPFQVDFDRIVFSTAFRRLQDKTQIFPLADNDFVHTRLTHSLETSCVGRSLGTIVGHEICKRPGLSQWHPSDFGAIVAAACLAHDIGNPPFGHSGEEAIRHWFSHSAFNGDDSLLHAKEKADILNYEGNAQGFRLLARLQMSKDRGGMRLTCATLGAFTKYPTASTSLDKTLVGAKKVGFYQAERELFGEVAVETGLLPLGGGMEGWKRHPLAFLVEAADDICYRIVDFEDGFRLGCVPFETVRDLFLAIIQDQKLAEKLADIGDRKNQVELLRALAIGKSIEQAAACFLAHEEEILSGTFNASLIDEMPAGPVLKEIKDISIPHIYGARQVVEIEAAGFEVLGGLLDTFAAAVFDGKGAKAETIRKLLPDQFRTPTETGRPYEPLLHLLDFVSGMTDSYAVTLYKKIKGISLPGRL